MVTAMKNRLFILAMLLCCTFAATAQNYNLRIHKNGDVQNQWNTSTISNIGLNNGVATFTISGSNIQKNFSEIDSITFATGGSQPTTYYTVTVVSDNTTMGTVSGGGSFAAGSSATISASANSGYHFVRWDDNNTQATRTITVTGNVTYRAYFEANGSTDVYYTLTVLSDNTTMGTAHGSGQYLANSSATISATANNGYHFVRWDDNNTTNPRTVTVTATATYTAFFAADAPGGGENHDTTSVDTESGIHITWNNGGAVTIVNEYRNSGLSIEAVGENVTVNAATGLDDLTYVLDGHSIDGNLIINTDKSLILYMDGLHLHSATGPAIRVVDDHRVTLHLATGSNNFISDTTNITATEHKAALQSQGKFEFQGDGTLTVKGYTKHAIQSSGKTIIMNGTVNVYGQSSTGDAMNVDDFVMQDGSLTINSQGDGIDGDQGHIQVIGGTINITCTSEGVKGMGCDSIINISGGNITINMSGADSKGISGNSEVYITDGTVNVTVTGNQSKGIKADANISISGGTTTVNANGTFVNSGTDISYCTGMKADSQVIINGGTVNVTCGSSNAGGKCISADGDVTVNNGTLTLSALGTSGTYTLSGTTKSYTTVGIKSNGNVTIGGGNITMTVGGKGISADGNFIMNGGETHITTSGAGAVTSGSGTSATDGYCSAGVSTDGSVFINAGSINCTSTGKGGRGFKVDGTFNVGTVGGDDDLIHVYAKTSGAPVNVSSSGGGMPGGGTSSDYWKGLPKGIKVTGSIHINSGHVNAFCAQTSGDATGEGIESKDSIIINGGYVESNSYDDAINASNFIQINGGYIWAYARGNDAIDCNGAENSGSGGGGYPGGGNSSSVLTIEITGGTIIASGSEVCIDDCGDRGGYISATNCTFVLIGGNMGVSEATPQLTGQKLLNISGSSSGGGGYPGGGGSSGGLTTAQNGFTIKNSSGTEIMTFKWPTVSNGQSGFEDTTAGAKPGPGGNSSSGIYVTTPQVQTGSYTVYSSPTITGGTDWHGLYTGATSTGGTTSTVSAQ